MTLRGYHYPDLDLFLGQADDNAFELLKFLEDHRLVTGEFVDKIHLCGACGSAFLNFRETCSHCHSANLRMEDLVHHFRCAHVAPLEEFQQNGGLRCAKCHHELKQIGVDYDKPSSVYICRECDHSTQEPDTSTLCFRCGMESIPERLGVHTVKAYSLTGLAENAAIHGLDNLFRSILEGELDILPLAVFRRFVNVEIERMKRYKLSRSSLVILHVQDLDRIYLEAGPRAKEIFSEFARIIHAALRPSDVITAFNDSLFLILATETGSDGATGMASRLTERLDGLVRSNFDHPALIKSHGMELSGHSSGDALIDQLIRQYLP
jgi:GGDEF domain-containing protein